MIVVRFKKTNPDVTLPQYETDGAENGDLFLQDYVRKFLKDMKYKSDLVQVLLPEMALPVSILPALSIVITGVRLK